MSKKNARPYSKTTSKNRNSRNNARTTNYNKNRKNVNKQKEIEKKLEHTTRIRIDEERINDYETLDTSFLEGRIDKKVKNNKKAKEKLLSEKKDMFINLHKLKYVFLALAGVALIVLLILMITSNSNKKVKETKKEKVEVVEKEDTKDKKVEKEIDDNYLFIGDFYIDKLDFEDYDYHYVKVSDRKYTTEDVKNDMNNLIYKYNPSIIFIHLGINDLDSEKSISEIRDNLEEIVEGIKENRPYAIIYLESLYPINKDVDDYDEDLLNEEIDNEKIRELNKVLKDISKENNIKYLDMYSKLIKNKVLNEDYTDNGVYLNDEGYSVIKKEIDKIVG